MAESATHAYLGQIATGEKLTYIYRQWDGLETFLSNGRVEIDSNAVDNLIRPIALTRNNVEPFAYPKATLEAIAVGHPATRIDELLPWNFKPAS